jgi:glycerate dehydrogenase
MPQPTGSPQRRCHIVVLERHSIDPGDNPLSAIESVGRVTFFDRTSVASEIVHRAGGADVIVINKAPITADVLKQLPQLQLICVTATGYDCVQMHAARQYGVTVCNVPEYSTDAVAQHVYALLLTLCRQVSLHDREIREGVWQQRNDFCFWSTPQIDLTGKTMGIVGLGRIGQRVAEIAAALKMTVVACSRSRSQQFTYPGFRWLDLETLFATADVVSLHCPLTPASRQMVNRSLLSRMRSSALLINTARGDLIVEPDLAEALAAGQLGGAALDTVSSEPIEASNPLLFAPHCLLTPHLAWATLAARRKLVTETTANIQAFLAGQPRNVVG